VFETAPVGAKKALGEPDGQLAGEPDCRLYEDAVYCAGENVLPVRLDAQTGKTVWRAALAPSGTESGMYSASLLGIQDDTVLLRQVISTESGENDPVHIVALDAETGDQLWQREVDDEMLDLVLSGDVVLTSDNGREVTGRSPRTGAKRWTVQRPDGYYCSFMTAGTGLYAYCTPDDADSETATARLLAVDRTDGSVRSLKAPLTSGILGILDDRLLLLESSEDDQLSGDGYLYTRILLVDPRTDARTTTKLAAGQYGDHVTLGGDTLWFTTSNGQVTAVSARTGKVLWQTSTSLEQPGEAHYDPRARTLYLASASGRAAALDGRKGTVLWETLPRTEWESSGSLYGPKVLVHGGALVVSTPNGTLFTIDPAHPERKPASG
jgi:outer membrane protein assembly factor BamB